MSVFVPQNTRRHAFTLIELMVSIALVLILMLGVSKVFKITGETISANQAISENTRIARAAQSTFADDFSHAVTTNTPYMIIHGQTQAAFRNLADLQSDRDYKATDAGTTTGDNEIRSVDLNGNNQEGEASVPGEVPSPALYNSRQHRVDILAFFVRGLFARQTGGTFANPSTPFIAPMTSSEALIWYGHLRIANDSGAVTASQDPGMGSFSPASNSKNFFATSWTLGRVATLLKEPDATNSILDANGVSQAAITGNGNILAPLAYGSVSSPPGFKLEQTRYDLASTSIAKFRSQMLAYTNDPTNDAGPKRWWSNFLMGAGGSRFQVNPVIVKPISPVTLSQQSALFMRGCSQFIVEYAGDYLKQNLDPTDTNPGGTGDADGVYGDIQDTYKRYDSTINIGTPLVNTNRWVQGQDDGQIDFVVVNGRREIRWYGMPRDTHGDGHITIANGDVAPLRDSWELSRYNGNPNQAQAGFYAPFEKLPNTSITAKNDYAAAGNLGLANTADYTCAWGPGDRLPKLIRITIVLDDPQGRTQDGQTFEYVFELP